VIVGGCITQTPTNNTVTNAATSQEFKDFLTKYKQRQVFSNNGSTVPDRSKYGIPEEVFSQLPPLPSDFLVRVYMVKNGRFFDITDLGENYWKQPEFDPEFTRMGLRYWTDIKDNNFKKTHWSTAGIRSYPYEQYVYSKPGDSFNVSLIFSADWSVEAFQGVKIIPYFMNSTFTSDGKSVMASQDASDYINVNVTPDEFLLTPAFPIFTHDWNRRVIFTGKISENTPPGNYILSFKIGIPSPLNEQKWYMEHLNLYSEGIELVKSDKPYLQALITVNR
jgi:hypothetical protein